jgi:Trk-type K+ transport system membrane component
MFVIGGCNWLRYRNCGFSLADLNMTPFGSTYGLIFPLILVILAGNTAYPVFLRLIM